MQLQSSSIPARFHTFVEINHEIISTAILLPSSGFLSVTSENNVQEVLVNHLFKLAEEQSVVR